MGTVHNDTSLAILHYLDVLDLCLHASLDNCGQVALLSGRGCIIIMVNELLVHIIIVGRLKYSQ